MKRPAAKKDWPYRWDLLLRYRLIEIIALWEGRLTTNHLCDTFGMGRQQASKDINDYLRTVAPGNLSYDSSLKGYVPTANFDPQVTLGTADEYLNFLQRNREISDTFVSLQAAPTLTEVIQAPLRRIHPEIIRVVVNAARQQQRIEVDYSSLQQPDDSGRIIVPHTLVNTGVRWHVRAWCEKNQDYRDFVLSRFRGTPSIEGDSPHGREQDTAWLTPVTVKLMPDTRLTRAQREVVARDYGMHRARLNLDTRGPLVKYLLDALRIDLRRMDKIKPEAQQVVVTNPDELKRWLI